jgi:hypothetical protein
MNRMGCGACWDETCREKGDVVRGGWADVARRLTAPEVPPQYGQSLQHVRKEGASRRSAMETMRAGQVQLLGEVTGPFDMKEDRGRAGIRIPRWKDSTTAQTA